MNRDAVTIRVDYSRNLGDFAPVWSFFGYDEPNYTYAANGKKLLAELAALSPTPVTIRAHNLLTSGDGTAALKWGSTNAYTEDTDGQPVYDWTLLDRIFDTYHQAGIRPLVEIGFMPEALSIQPQPYRHDWPHGRLWTGWAYPPKDYAKWAELVFQWVRHAMERYGQAEVETWFWEVWNEPDIGYWQGTPEEYFQLYDYAADAVKRALPTARIGGPHTTGGGTEFLRRFLEHCSRGRNAATGGTGTPLDFIAFHPKGAPQFVDGHVRMGIGRHLQVIADNLEVIASFPKWRETPVILGESDPEGCAACSAGTHPENAYREGPLYGAYTAAALNNILELAAAYHANLQGIVTWAFTFEDQPFFAGFRELATNGIDKPVLNVFRMLGKMDGLRLFVESSGGLTTEAILRDGVRGQPDISALAAGREGQVSVLLWNYHDDDVAAPEAPVELTVESLPLSAQHATLRHYRVDARHSNAYTVWQQMGSPQPPTAEQYARLEAVGQLQPLAAPQTLEAQQGTVQVSFPLPRQGVSLVQITWE